MYTYIRYHIYWLTLKAKDEKIIQISTKSIKPMKVCGTLGIFTMAWQLLLHHKPTQTVILCEVLLLLVLNYTLSCCITRLPRIWCYVNPHLQLRALINQKGHLNSGTVLKSFNTLHRSVMKILVKLCILFLVSNILSFQNSRQNAHLWQFRLFFFTFLLLFFFPWR